MKKVKWTPKGSTQGHVTAKVGCVKMNCFSSPIRTEKPRWWANAYIPEFRRTVKCGVMRHSLRKAKDDAERMACELMLDVRAGITKALRSCGVAETDLAD